MFQAYTKDHFFAIHCSDFLYRNVPIQKSFKQDPQKMKNDGMFLHTRRF